MSSFASVGIDSPDPTASARWWADALGWSVVASAPEEAEVTAPDPHGAPRLVFLAVPEPKTVKNRVHLDLSSQDDDDQRRIVDHLRAMGATPVDIGQQNVPWVVLADPDGNELCVLEPRERYRGAGPLASIVIDAADPRALAHFWAEATGWSIGDEADGYVTLHHPSGRPPDIDLVRVADPKLVKNRLHLDLVAPGGGVDAEAHRLIDEGATRIDIGQGDVPWVVLADPEGNELCVLPQPEVRL